LPIEVQPGLVLHGPGLAMSSGHMGWGEHASPMHLMSHAHAPLQSTSAHASDPEQFAEHGPPLQ
jgi:hypothetical protein